MCKSECISEVLGTLKWANWLILKFPFLAYLGHFCMFNSSNYSRKAPNVMKILMYLFYHVVLVLDQFYQVWTIAWSLRAILCQAVLQLPNCDCWRRMTAKLWDDAYMYQAFKGIMEMCSRRSMNIFRAVCTLLPLLELLNMQKCPKWAKMEILRSTN